MNFSTEAAMFHDALLRENEAAREMIRIYRNDRNVLLSALRDCVDYLNLIPEPAAGGDDDAFDCLKKALAAIASVEGTA